MKYTDILHDSKEYGDGNRVVLLVAPRNEGITFGGEEAADIFQELASPNVDGLTLAGDDPLSTRNIPLLTELCKYCKEDYPEKTIYCYTKQYNEKNINVTLDKCIDLYYNVES